MTVLIAVASKHGATREIAERISRTLQEAGIDADVRDAAEVDDVARYPAAVIGSAVYMGGWLEPARDLVRREQRALAAMPVWLFSSGPLGHPLRPVEVPTDAVHLAELVSARGSQVFGGRLDRQDLRVGEKAIVRMVHAPYGDYRPWDEIAAWGRSIAEAVTAGARTA